MKLFYFLSFRQQWQAEQLVEQDESLRLLIINAHITPYVVLILHFSRL
jgi:hypothetical protein